jgi:hypothetical protein
MARRDQAEGWGDAHPASGTARRAAGAYSHLVLGLLGAFLGLALLKFGNPVIFEGKLPPPSNLPEFLYFSWPVQWGWMILIILAMALLPVLQFPRRIPKWLFVAPIVWWLWQWVATLDSVDPALSRLTAAHFTLVAGCYFLGLLATRGIPSSMVVWIGIGIGLCLVVSSGFRQQFGGLEQTRVFYEKLAKGEQPPEIQSEFDRPEIRRIWESPLFQFKVRSRRIYSTLFYPNTLAGVMLLLTPGLLAAVWFGLREASTFTRTLLAGLLGLGALGCLVWSGSKAGWLIALVQGGLLLLRTSIPVKWRRTILLTLAVLGVAGLVLRNLSYFQRGATSVSARTDYWVSAGQILLENPVTGTGPGTFGREYERRKASNSEMARLAHNDFVQQASDSGAIGFLSYSLFVIGALWWSFKHLQSDRLSLAMCTWLGLAGWGLQSLSEFGLYIPAVAWPAFFLLGTTCREAANRIDTSGFNV